jgi:hypothetical protein
MTEESKDRIDRVLPDSTIRALEQGPAKGIVEFPVFHALEEDNGIQYFIVGLRVEAWQHLIGGLYETDCATCKASAEAFAQIMHERYNIPDPPWAKE